MHCFELQPWVTIRGPANVVITQGASGWLDLRGYRDIVLWTEVAEVSNVGTGDPATLSYETCPTTDDVLFAAAVAPFLPAPGVQVNVVHRDTAGVPLARWLRWQLAEAPSSTWDITFRVWVSASRERFPTRQSGRR